MTQLTLLMLPVPCATLRISPTNVPPWYNWTHTALMPLASVAVPVIVIVLPTVNVPLSGEVSVTVGSVVSAGWIVRLLLEKSPATLRLDEASHATHLIW